MDQFKTIRWLIYARKSEDDRDKQVQSIGSQIGELQLLRKRLGGLNVIDIIREEQSAKEPGRPRFNAMIKRIKRGEADGILIWAYHRLSRNPVDDGTIQWLLQQGTLKAIKTIDRVYLPGDNALLLRIEGGTANQFILDLRKNVLRGLKQKLEKGWMPGKAVLGYLNTKTEKTGENYIIKDPERFDILRRSWDMMLTAKYLPSQILNVMNNEWGLRTRKTKREGGKALSRSGLYRIFSDPFYAGLFRYNGKLHQGQHEPMITIDEFDRVQVLLGKYGRPRPQKHVFKYTGIMKCGVCGSAITATKKKKVLKTTGELKTYTFYHCTKNKKSEVPCNQSRNLPESQLEEMILEELNKNTITKELKDMALEIIQTEDMNTSAEIKKIHRSQQNALESTQRELENLTSLRIRDLITDDEFIAHKKQLGNKITILKQKEIESHNNVVDWQKYLSEAFQFAHHGAENFKKGTEKEKKDLFITLGQNHTLKDGKLFIDKAKWLETIKKSCDEMEDGIKPSEPRNTTTAQSQNASFAMMRPRMLTLVEEVRTTLPKDLPEELSFREMNKYILSQAA
jgi:hypothetical protein